MMTAAERERRDRDVCGAIAAALLAMDRGDVAGAEAVLRQVPTEDVARVALRFLHALAHTIGAVDAVARVAQNFGHDDISLRGLL